jgi:glycosyltransferase involved in cell wall biosynthesis
MFKIVSCFWNAESYLTDCINSITMQSHNDYMVYLVDDMSTDGSVELAKRLISDDNRFILISNSEKHFKLKNFDRIISSFNDDDIVVELDGDDSLFGDDVLAKLSQTYKNEEIWLTNGSFIFSNGSLGFSSRCDSDTIRSDVFTFSHLRSWKAFLWKAIPKEYFMDDHREYFRSAADVAFSLPLLELAGNKHYKFLKKVMYVYNDVSPYNDHKSGSASGGRSEQLTTENKIRQKKPLTPLAR